MNMEICFLCLETNSGVVKSIRVNSTQWQIKNLKYLIEKHLWVMDNIQQSSLVCSNCWQVLNDFHNYYIRIKEAHSKLVTVMTTDNEPLLSNIQLKSDFMGIFEIKDVLIKDQTLLNSQQKDVSNEIFDKDAQVRDNYDTEILIEQPLPADFVIENKNIYIKKEQDQEFFTDKLQENETRKQKPYNTEMDEILEMMEDPLNKEKQPKPKKDKEVTKKSINVHEKSDNEVIKDETKLLESRDSTDSDEAESEYHSYSEPVKVTKKKRKNLDEKTGQEYDRFISDNFQIVCSFCHVSLENFIALRKHFRDKHNKRGFVICCKKKIFSRPLLVDHIHIHLDPNYFKCQHCDKVYSERSTLETHVKIHEMGQLDRNHICDNCGKTFVGTTQLENHKRIHEPGYQKQFSCPECGKFFTTSYSLNYHIQAIHHNKFVNICDICGKTMRCRNQFKLHMEKHNSKESMSMNCDICGLRLTDRRGLRRHKNLQHPVGGKKDYSCHLCLKVSPNQEALRTHIRLTHSTSYNHKCTMCEKAFKRPYALREHMATHTGTALYTCPWCPKTFISNGNMHNHRKKAHPQEWEEAHRKKFANNLQTDTNSNVKDNLCTV